MTRRAEPAALRYRITLTCGHSIPTREKPWNASTHYACREGQGCGYRLAWVSWREGDHVGLNPGAAAVVDPPPGPP